MAELKDPCGNPIPIVLPATGYAFSLPSLKTLLDLLGAPHLPATEIETPCPKLLDQLAAAAKRSTGT